MRLRSFAHPPRTARRPAVSRFIAVLSAIVASACTPPLPEPESSGAKLYEARCSACHRLYPPTVMTVATWNLIVDRMQGEMQRRGFPPLDADESKLLLDYLGRHALKSGVANDQS